MISTLLKTTLLAMIISDCYSESENSVIVSLKQGKIEGKREFATKGREFLTFLGIPYGKPPVGELRFKKPEPFGNWEGTKDGKQSPSQCSQFQLNVFMMDGKVNTSGEEDCLIVNVHTPRISGEPNLPVMVYFHGGAFVFGGHLLYEANELLNEDVVLVLVQYRLGALGFLSTEDSVIPGNQGLWDQNLALKWVNENIQKFSGDLNKIMISGNSAGGASVHSHILSEKSAGLFSRAIVQSGSLLCPWARMVRPRQVAMQLGNHFGCFKSDPNSEGEAKSNILLNCLQKVDAHELQHATHTFFKWSFLPATTVPYADGDFFSDDFETLIQSGKYKSLDVIYGVTRDDGSWVSHPFLVMGEQRKAIKDDFKTVGPISLVLENEDRPVDVSKSVYERYVGGIKNDIEDDQNLNEMLGDRHFKICCDLPAIYHAEKNEKEGKKTFYYEIHHKGLKGLSILWGNPPSAQNWVGHAEELPFMFPTTMWGENVRDEADSRMRDLFTKMWVNFADTGNPTPDTSLGFHWDEFTTQEKRHLKITTKPEMADDRREEIRKFWANLPLRENMLLFGNSQDDVTKEEL